MTTEHDPAPGLHEIVETPCTRVANELVEDASPVTATSPTLPAFPLLDASCGISLP